MSRSVWTMAALALTGPLMFAPLAGCGDEVGDAFFDFVARADREPPPPTGLVGAGVLTDIRGDYLFNISLRVIGEIFLPLRVTFDTYELQPGDATTGPFALVSGGFYFPEDGPDAVPLAVFSDAVLDQNGRVELDLGFVRIEPARSPIKDTAVEVDFRLQVVVIDVNTMCGIIDDNESAVFQPIQILLKGVTFAAQRYGEDGVVPEGVPSECPEGYVREEGEPDPEGSGDGSGDGSGEGSGDAPIPVPDVDIGPGVQADITGRYWLQVNVLGAIALDMLAFTRIRQDGDRTFVDGALYLTRNGFEIPPVGTFTSEVDANGRFIASVRGLRVVTDVTTVEADIAMLASIKSPDLWCGVAGGEVFAPPLGELFDTTFAAVRFEDGTNPPYERGYRPPTALVTCPP